MGEHTPALSAAIACAAMTGDAEKITRFILSKNPDLTRPFFPDSPQERLLDLSCRMLADPVVLIDYVEHADSIRHRAFIDMLHQFVRDHVVLGDYLPMLREVAANVTDSVLQSRARDLLDRYESLRAADRERK
ncbi:MAG: hypothetical protein EDM82_01055 [Cyanobacteria bacterium CYA]|nr:MAG: hypothetical protein EDM82_01055 [Cyanobacteria bacterium CYA]